MFSLGSESITLLTPLSSPHSPPSLTLPPLPHYPVLPHSSPSPSSLTPPLLPHSSPFGCRPPYNCVFVSQSSQQKTQHLFNVLRNIIRVLLCVGCVWVCVGVGEELVCLSLAAPNLYFTSFSVCVVCCCEPGAEPVRVSSSDRLPRWYRHEATRA